MDIVICLTTVESQEEAKSLATRCVEQNLAACVNIIPRVSSIYKWKGTVHSDEEILLVIKTSRSRVSELQKFVLSQHSYETPEFVAIDTSSFSEEYARWVQGSTA